MEWTLRGTVEEVEPPCMALDKAREVMIVMHDGSQPDAVLTGWEEDLAEGDQVEVTVRVVQRADDASRAAVARRQEPTAAELEALLEDTERARDDELEALRIENARLSEDLRLARENVEAVAADASRLATVEAQLAATRSALDAALAQLADVRKAVEPHASARGLDACEHVASLLLEVLPPPQSAAKVQHVLTKLDEFIARQPPEPDMEIRAKVDAAVWFVSGARYARGEDEEVLRLPESLLAFARPPLKREKPQPRQPRGDAMGGGAVTTTRGRGRGGG